MLFYTHNDEFDWQKATIHNIDTGITYKLEMQRVDGARVPVVEIITPEASSLHGKSLFWGEQAVEFWRALLFRNPWNGSPTSPRHFLDELVGKNASELEEGNPF